MPLPRMTVRRWMVAIFVVTVYSLAIRSLVCLGLAAYHESKLPHRRERTTRGRIHYDRDGKIMTPAQMATVPAHRDAARMCRKAAWWPWDTGRLVVPEPE